MAFTVACSRGAHEAERGASPQPEVHAQAAARLILVTDLERVLEPCGCTSRPRGGVDRLATTISELQRDAKSALVLAAGDMFASQRGAGMPARVQDDWQADVLSAVLQRFGLAALAVGEADRAREAKRVAALAREAKLVLLGSTAGEPALEAVTPSTLLRAGEVAIGLVAIGNAVGGCAEPAAGARRVEQLRARGAQLVIAFVHGDADLARTAARTSHADFVVQSGIGDVAAVSAAEGSAPLLSAGARGERLLALDVWPGRGSGPWPLLATAPSEASQRGVVVRDRDISADQPRDPAVRALLDQLFARVNAHNAEAYREAESPPVAAGAPSYVGSRTCAACHTQAYFWWQRTPHARAFEMLVGRKRQLDLDCIGCHVTGYEQPGGSSIGRLDELKGVGCESCHGPGSAHVDNPQQPGRAIRRGVPEATCVACHDHEHSDLFRYAEARERLLVPAHGASKPASNAIPR